jgi:hypothetical protein
MRPYLVTRIVLRHVSHVVAGVGGMFAVMWLLAACAILAGCASMLPNQVIDGIAVYIRDGATVDNYCRPRVRPADRGPRMYGCYIAADRTIMVAEGHPAVLAHELKHAQGWDHVGVCHSTVENPNGVRLDGTPCEWFRK